MSTSASARHSVVRVHRQAQHGQTAHRRGSTRGAEGRQGGAQESRHLIEEPHRRPREVD